LKRQILSILKLRCSVHQQNNFCISNISSQCQLVNLRDINLINTDEWHDLISGRIHTNISELLRLQPYQVPWISNSTL